MLRCVNGVERWVLYGVTAAVALLGIAELVKRLKAANGGKGVKGKDVRITIAVLLGLAALGLAAATHVVDGMELCDTSTVTRPATSEEVSPITSEGTPVEVETEKCSGVSLPQAALLLVPALFLLLPDIGELTLGGVISLKLRGVEVKLEGQAAAVEEIRRDIIAVKTTQSVATAQSMNITMTPVMLANQIQEGLVAKEERPLFGLDSIVEG